MDSSLTPPEDRVLTTLDADGSRHWIYPKLAQGTFLRWRRVVAYLLIALYTLLPFISIGGKPTILLDIVHGEFTFFGFTFLPTDMVLLAIFVVTLFLTLFFVTAIAGRVWCGWACPQTVYMEFVFRPIERLCTGTTGVGNKPKKNVAPWRIAAMYFLYLLICLHLSHTFLSYFVGVKNLHDWIWTSPPWQHPGAFAVVAFITGLMMFDFCYWREQLCIIGCPYGRFQSVLLDRGSATIGYDCHKGEPRGRGRDREEKKLGHCVDCHLCVDVCPTGIDIRDGLQLECIGCAQCIDICDQVMDKTNQPRGLIRYSSMAGLEGEPTKLLRPRTVIYFTGILLLAGLFLFLLATQSAFDVTMLRGPGRLFMVDEPGSVDNLLRVKIVNRTDQPRDYHFAVIEPANAKIHAGTGAKQVEPGTPVTEAVLLRVPIKDFRAKLGRIPLRFEITDDLGNKVEQDFLLLGPSGPIPEAPLELPEEEKAKGEKNGIPR